MQTSTMLRYLLDISAKRVLATSTWILLAMCALIIMWPPSDQALRYRSETKWFVTQEEMIPAEIARAEALQILETARQLSANGALTPDNLFPLQKRMLWLSRHAEQNGPNPRLGAVYWDGQSMFQLASIRDNDINYRNLSKVEHERYRAMFTTNPEYLEIEKFWPSKTTSNGWIVFWRYVQRYIMTIPLGMFACFLTMRYENIPLGISFVNIFSHPLRMAFYPFGLLWILITQCDGSYKESLKRLVSWLSYATATSISLFCGGVASAQTVKKDGDKKKINSYALQLDSRVIIPVEGPPTSLFNRTTLNAKRWVTDSISTFSPKSKAWSSELGFGIKPIHSTKTTLSTVGLIFNDSAGTKKIMAGVQYFHSGPTYTIAIPVARIEKTLNGPVSFATVVNPIFKLGRNGLKSRIGLSPDVLIRKTLKKPLSWTAGLGVDAFIRKGKADRAEIAILRTFQNQWQFRGRYIVNFAF